MDDKDKKSKRSYRSLIIKLLILLLLCLGSIGILSFFVLGGHAKNLLCKVVYEGSFLYDQVNCGNISISQQEDTGNSANQSKIFDQIVGDEGERVASIVEEVAGGVVGIGVSGDNFTEDQIIGTGFLVSSNGILVTNRHVVENLSLDYFISFKDQELTIPVPQDFIFLDPVNDIALIKIESSNVPSTAKILNVGNSDELKLGQTVIAIGNPLGTYTGSITKGIISGLNREVNISQGFFSTQSEVYEDVIQTDAAINPGNSGGPLLNLNAQVIGVNFATVDGASNLSFALPINRIQDRISELEEFGKFKIPYLGVEYRTRLVFFKGQSIVGAEIINVVNNSPAALAGINIGDIVIEFDTTDLSEKTLSALIQEHEIGSTVQVIIIRNRVEQEIKVTIGER